MKILFNADDFGLSKGVTDGIIKAHTDGVIGSTTMMMNGHATNYAVEQAIKCPTLKVGIHLVLTWGKPLCREVDELITQDGFFKYNNTFNRMSPPNIEQVEREWRTQIKAFLQTGLPLHHIDSHHHVHGWEPLKELIIKLAGEYNVPVRFVDTLNEKGSHHLLLTDKIWLGFYGDGVQTDVFEHLQALETDSIEVMTHPAIIDDELKQASSYVQKRKQELDILCSLNVPDWAKIIQG